MPVKERTRRTTRSRVLSNLHLPSSSAAPECLKSFICGHTCYYYGRKARVPRFPAFFLFSCILRFPAFMHAFVAVRGTTAHSTTVRACMPLLFSLQQMPCNDICVTDASNLITSLTLSQCLLHNIQRLVNYTARLRTIVFINHQCPAYGCMYAQPHLFCFADCWLIACMVSEFFLRLCSCQA